jgi:hypothetical protein
MESDMKEFLAVEWALQREAGAALESTGRYQKKHIQQMFAIATANWEQLGPTRDNATIPEILHGYLEAQADYFKVPNTNDKTLQHMQLRQENLASAEANLQNIAISHGDAESEG